MDVFESKRHRREFVVVAIAVLLAFAALTYLARAQLSFLSGGAELRAVVSGYGVAAPLVFIGLLTAQVVLAPIPGQGAGFVSGYLFGSFHGSIYSLVGITLGSAIAFWLSRRFGRPFVERVVRDDLIERFDAFVGRTGLLGLFVVFLVPGPPDDVVCFVAGLTDIDLWKLVVVAFVGRAPSYVVANVTGAGLANGEFGMATVLVLLFLAGSVWGYLRRDWLLDVFGEE